MENNKLDIIGANACGIYGFMFPDNKWLVGYSNQIIIRLGKYFGGEKMNQKFKCGVSKYGWPNIKVFILEECENKKSVLLEREAYWSNKFDSVNNGYNVAPCGLDCVEIGKVTGHLQKTVYDDAFKIKVSRGMKEYHARKKLGTPPH